MKNVKLTINAAINVSFVQVDVTRLFVAKTDAGVSSSRTEIRLFSLA
jgi:hypothetical protein